MFSFDIFFVKQKSRFIKEWKDENRKTRLAAFESFKAVPPSDDDFYKNLLQRKNALQEIIDESNRIREGASDTTITRTIEVRAGSESNYIKRTLETRVKIDSYENLGDEFHKQTKSILGRIRSFIPGTKAFRARWQFAQKLDQIENKLDEANNALAAFSEAYQKCQNTPSSSSFNGITGKLKPEGKKEQAHKQIASFGGFLRDLFGFGPSYSSDLPELNSSINSCENTPSGSPQLSRSNRALSA